MDQLIIILTHGSNWIVTSFAISQLLLIILVTQLFKNL